MNESGMKMTVHVFGKEGCTKCAALKSRIERLLQKEDYAMFKMEYHDILTLDGIVAFCKTGCLNPNRIPAMMVSDDTGKAFDKWIEPPWDWEEGAAHDRPAPHRKYDPAATYPYLGIQTDYDTGGGLIRPESVEDILKGAKQMMGTV